MSADAATQQNATPKKRRPQKWEKAFITALALYGVVSHACTAAKIDRSTAYRNRDEHEDFAEAWKDALEIAADALELEARRRAYEGVEEPVYGKGSGPNAGTVKVGTIRKYSDTLMMFLLKGARPEKFRERFDHNLHGPNNGAIPVQVFESALDEVYGDGDGDDDADPTTDPDQP
jgi:hypothetical protein